MNYRHEWARLPFGTDGFPEAFGPSGLTRPEIAWLWSTDWCVRCLKTAGEIFQCIDPKTFESDYANRNWVRLPVCSELLTFPEGCLG